MSPARRKTRFGATGAGGLNLSCPVLDMLLDWEMSGGSPTLSTGMAAVSQGHVLGSVYDVTLSKPPVRLK